MSEGSLQRHCALEHVVVVSAFGELALRPSWICRRLEDRKAHREQQEEEGGEEGEASSKGGSTLFSARSRCERPRLRSRFETCFRARALARRGRAAAGKGRLDFKQEVAQGAQHSRAHDNRAWNTPGHCADSSGCTSSSFLVRARPRTVACLGSAV